MQRADAYPTDPNAHGDESTHAHSIKDTDMDTNPIIHTYRDGIGYTIEHANGDIYEYPYIDSHVIAYINRNTHVHAERDADEHSDGGAAEHRASGDVGPSMAVLPQGEQMTPPPPVHNHPLEMQIYQTVSTYPLLPINEDAAIYKYAQAHNLGHPQMSEQEVMWGGDVYVFQTYQRGTVYVKKGEWDAITHLAKVG